MNIRKPKKIKNRDFDNATVAKAQAILDQFVADGLAWKGPDGRYRYIDEGMDSKQ